LRLRANIDHHACCDAAIFGYFNHNRSYIRLLVVRIILRLILFEGVDRCGKTTQTKLFCGLLPRKNWISRTDSLS
jgi:predicted AAA+ superfamily ATPase